jgi:hypothetical protein
VSDGEPLEELVVLPVFEDVEAEPVVMIVAVPL